MSPSLWWIPRARVRELSASDLAVLRMCRVLTLFLAAAIVYVVVIVSGVGARAARDRLRLQVEHCGCRGARTGSTAAGTDPAESLTAEPHLGTLSP